jgi:hypothetical protein
MHMQPTGFALLRSAGLWLMRTVERRCSEAHVNNVSAV